MLQQHIVEGFWFNDRLYVWGMDATLPLVTDSRRRVPPHPYALPPEDLGRRVDGAGADTPRVAVLHLPGWPRHPMAPPGLLPPGRVPAQVAPPTLRPWSVPVRELDPGAASVLLSRADAPWAGGSLRHLAALSRSAREHAGNGCVVPSIRYEETVRVRWRPVLAPAGFSWLREAASSSPPSLRAHHPPESDPDRAGEAVVTDLLECLCALTDVAVRDLLDHRFPDRPGDGDLVGAAGPTREWFVRAHRAATGDLPSVTAAAPVLPGRGVSVPTAPGCAAYVSDGRR
ncbi:hypothetical protein PWG71_18235 [Nocardiopsis sp. N85]|uniref:hypothetical protein n=1 Tax=Nocardiopsis sp. N85 TaxID=3029400 RepID=UPI00237F5754|nr:hypothetical protein [Nocardiopsis sp. N85]MDE3723336.1 hypothetical protein [Nocardiopsis sp. N85]